MKQRTRHAACLCLLLALCHLRVQAASDEDATRLYQVDILLFTRPLAVTRWPSQVSRPAVYEQALRLKPWREEPGEWQPPMQADDPSLHLFEQLPEARRQLLREHARLANNSHHRPVAHFSWIQPAPERKRATSVRLQPPTTVDVQTETLAGLLTRPQSPATDDGHRTPDGTATLYRGTYLHLKLDLYHCQPTEQYGWPQTHPSCWRLSQSYRIRPDRLYYFDHPHFGALARVTAIDRNTDSRANMR